MNPKRLMLLSAACMCLLAFPCQAASPAGQARLDATSDATCQLQINGKASGTLQAGVKRSLQVNPGTVELLCTSAPKTQERTQVEVKPGETANARLRFLWRATDQGVVDAGQSLVWTRSDNGADIDWTAAGAWCASLGKDWRLPTRAELERLTASAAGETTPCRDAQCKVPGLFTLSGYWMWSSDRNQAGNAYYHYLHTTHTQVSPVGYQLNARALCVRPQ
ncbi:DUF1566 domain-containing protein [Ramlibacter sp.]|uniref:Lcl domain-containing protein n=1 Tax=Ramlibacter sp. TaxID=1917967 RepID=UPI0035B3AC2C